MTPKQRKELANSIGGLITKAITTAEPDEDNQEEGQPDAEEITKKVTEGVLAEIGKHPFFKALEGAQKDQEPDEQAEMKKYVRRAVRRAVKESIEVASAEIIKGVKKQVMEMFGGEDQIKKLNLIGKKLRVVGKKKSKSPEDEDDDGDEDEDDEGEPKPKGKKFKKRGGKQSFEKEGSVEDLDEALGKRARGALGMKE